MKVIGTAVLLVALLAAVALAALETGREQQTESSHERLLRGFYAPPADQEHGRLYEPAVKLLSAARALPKAIDLGEVGPVEEVVETAAEEPAQEPVQIVQLPDERWVSVVDQPVVDDDTLAYVYFLAERYEEAATLYSRLCKQTPGDSHLMVMWLLSQRNAGRAPDARKLLKQLSAHPEASSWAEWVFEMADMGQTERQATQ